MCITPEKSGVRLQTVVGTNKGIDELVIPDGVARPITDAECKGTEQAEWSNDGARVFRTTDVTCGKEPARTIKTVAFLAPGPSWINVQHVSGAAANASVRVQRYRRAANQKLADGSTAQQPDARLAMRTTADRHDWSIEDVIEASAQAAGRSRAGGTDRSASRIRHEQEDARRARRRRRERIGDRSDGRAHLPEALRRRAPRRQLRTDRRSRPARAGSTRSCHR